MPLDLSLLELDARKKVRRAGGVDADVLRWADEYTETHRTGGVDLDVLRWADKYIEEAPEEELRPKLTPAEREEALRRAEEERLLAQAHKELGETALPSVRAYSIEAGADIVSPLARLAGKGEYADRMVRWADAIEQAQQKREVGGLIPDVLQRGVRGAGRSLTSMAGAGMVGGPYAAIGVAAGQETNRAITEGKDAGLRGTELAGYAVSQGVIEAAPAMVMQRVGLGGTESLVAGKQAVASGVREALKRMGMAVAEEVPEELVTEIGHAVAAKVAGVDPESLTKDSLRQIVEDTTVQTVLTVGMAGAPGVARAAQSRRAAAREAEIVAHAEEKRAPSRKTWKRWGMDPEAGKSAKQRREVTQHLATMLKAVREAATQLTEAPVAPVAETTQEPAMGAEAASEPPAATEQESAALESAAGQPIAPEVTTTPAKKPAVVPQEEAEPAVVRQVGPIEHDFPAEVKGTGERVSAREVVRRIGQIWGVPIREGRVGGRRGGIFKMKPQVARLARGEEASGAVAVHEAIGHYLDSETRILKGDIPKAALAELGQFDYDQTKQRASEGLSEYLRGYLTGGIEIARGGIDVRAQAPEFTRHFEAWLDKHPDIKQKMVATKPLFDAYRRAGAVGRVKGQISKTGRDVAEIQPPLKKRVNEWKELLYTRIKEEGRPVARFVEEAKKRGYIPGKETDPFEDYSALRQIGPHFAANAIEHGVFRLSDHQMIGPSLIEALAEIEDDEDYENFVAWAYARHAVESWSKGKDPGITLQDAQETQKQLYDPRYERAAAKITAFNDALIDVLVDSGALEVAEAAKIKGYYQTYIPLRRARRRGGVGGGRKLVDLSKPLRGRSGSGLQIIDPLEATLSRAIQLYERAAKQVVTDKIVRVARETKGLGIWVERVPTKNLPTKFTISEIKDQLSGILADEFGEGGFTKEEIDTILSQVNPYTALTVWRPDLMTDKSGEPIARIMIDGQQQFYQLHPELHKSLGGLDTLQNLGIVTRVFRGLNKAVKIGATRANPDFILTNALRDLQTFLIQGERGLRGVFDPAHWATAYVLSEMRAASGEVGDPVVRLYKRMGGELSTYTGLDRDRLRKGVRRARAGRQDYLATGLNIAGTPEVASRLAEFAQVLHREGWLDRAKRGETPPMPVLIRAINAAHDVTVDFRRMGKWGRYLNYYIPFLNAQLEGFDKTVRTFRKYPGRTALRVVMNRIPLALTYWWFRHNDDDYRERPEWQDGFWTFPDEDGNPIVRIPKPHEWGLIDSAIERMLDAIYEKDPEPIERWFKQAIGTVLPNNYPAGITPLFETMFNYSSFGNRPVVSRRLQKLEPVDQYYDHTTKLARQAAMFLYEYSRERVNLSPAKIDHLADGLTGGGYRRLVKPVEKVAGSEEEWAASDVPGLGQVTFRGDYAKSVDDFYAERGRLAQRHESNRLLEKRGKPKREEDLPRWRRFEAVSSLMTQMLNEAKAGSAEERRVTDLALTGLARKALDREPLERYPNPLADPSGLPEVVAKVVRDHIGMKASTASRNIRGPRGWINPKTKETVESARQYLRDMDVPANEAAKAAFTRMLTQGYKRNTAMERARNLGNL